MRSALVTGATGFIGSHVCQRLATEGVRVRTLTRSSDTSAFEAVRITDIRDRAGLRGALSGVDTVVHLAARVHVLRETAADPLGAFRKTNVEGTRVLFEEALQAGVQRFMFLSSVSALGVQGRCRLSDSDPAVPDTEYGQSKLEAEQALEELASGSVTQVVILRPPGVYGPRMKGNVLRLIRLVDRGIPIPVPGEGNRRSLIFVDNLVEAAVQALRRDAPGLRRYLVSDRECLSTAELVRVIGQALGRRPRVLPIPGGPMRVAGQVGDWLSPWLPFPVTTAAVDRLFGSLVVEADALTRDTGFDPPYSVEQGMRRTAEWYRETRLRN